MLAKGERFARGDNQHNRVSQLETPSETADERAAGLNVSRATLFRRLNIGRGITPETADYLKGSGRL